MGLNPTLVLAVFFFFASPPFHLSEARALFESTTGLLRSRAGQSRLVQLNEAVEEKGLSLDSSLSLHSVALKNLPGGGGDSNDELVGEKAKRTNAVYKQARAKSP